MQLRTVFKLTNSLNDTMHRALVRIICWKWQKSQLKLTMQKRRGGLLFFSYRTESPIGMAGEWPIFVGPHTPDLAGQQLLGHPHWPFKWSLSPLLTGRTTDWARGQGVGTHGHGSAWVARKLEDESWLGWGEVVGVALAPQGDQGWCLQRGWWIYRQNSNVHGMTSGL